MSDEHAVAGGATEPAAPPRRLDRNNVHFTGITRARLTELLDSYNAWVGLWNTHELDPSLTLSPPWADGEAVLDMGGWLPRSCLAFRTLPDRRFCIIRLRGWSQFNDHLPLTHQKSFCRRPASERAVVWAGISREAF